MVFNSISFRFDLRRHRPSSSNVTFGSLKYQLYRRRFVTVYVYTYNILPIIMWECVFIITFGEKKRALLLYSYFFERVQVYRSFLLYNYYLSSVSFDNDNIIASPETDIICFVVKNHLLPSQLCPDERGGRAISPIRNSTQQRTDDETLITVKIDHTSYNVSKITMKKYSKLD